MKNILIFTMSACAFLVPSFTFAAPQKADMSITLLGPATHPIATSAAYTITIKNNGPVTAKGINVEVTFPLTNTSPAVSILGTVTGVTSPCVIQSNKMKCTIASLNKNTSTSFNYQYNAPVSTKTLAMNAVVTTTITSDNNTGNNSASIVPNLTYPARPIVSGNVSNSHCTGTNLTSYFECALYPSSIQTHTTVFNADNSITFTEPGYTGQWQHPGGDTTKLRFEYFDGSSAKEIEFNGRSINGSNCFDGLTQFFPATTYVSPYHVCITP